MLLKPFGKLIRERSAFRRSIKQNTDVGQRGGLSKERLNALACAFRLVENGKHRRDSSRVFGTGGHWKSSFAFGLPE
jgi:hypothetical protein